MSEFKKTIKVKALTAKDIEAAIERIKGAFPDDKAEDAIEAVAYRCVCFGACAMADEIVHGERGDEKYAEMREDIASLAELTALEHALRNDGVEVHLGALGDLLEAVRG